ncbi:hypothetical protein [Rheinheimera sp. MMS21-TC3]|uniref:hypothetical protein n=1 Tax=Rheinheimera sp. MMS21-TC3 TaxID=3072790 RepID=UPI0028C3DF0B|nr:hypothetical protein [Rheinheimera sp. MMS21-TC3]WNO61173.1 hypothetical protein RDV63_09490 [Rheinheimera sp. MMS21-TC3]
MSRFIFFIMVILALLLSACGDSKSIPEDKTTIIKPPPVMNDLPIPDNRNLENYQVLLVGNSHVRTNNLAKILKLMLEKGTGKSSVATLAPGVGYLDSRMDDNVTKKMVESKNWSHIIWQAQKYSTTGKYTYSTIAAEYWVTLSKENKATPILFPEHPREGNIEEGMRVYLLHRDIASLTASCVAPIGPIWDHAIPAMPDISFYTDGNHASLAGTVLTALAFYQIISGKDADKLAYIPEIDLSKSLQTQLGQIAFSTLQQFTACDY